MKLGLPKYLNNLSILDLSYLHNADESSIVLGGKTSASTSAGTIAGPGYAVAGASSSASGPVYLCSYSDQYNCSTVWYTQL